MSEHLLNHLCGRWLAGQGPGVALFDPVLGEAAPRSMRTRRCRAASARRCSAHATRTPLRWSGACIRGMAT